MKKRSIAAVIILSIITCGIYSWYWVYTTAKDLEDEGHSGGTSPTVQLVLSIFIYVVGYILFGMAADANINAIKSKRGIPTSDNKVVYIILAIFIPIVLVGLVQNEVNKLAE